MKAKFEFFRKGTDYGGRPNIVAEIKRDEWKSVNKWSRDEIREATAFLKIVRKRINKIIIEFEDLDNS